MNKSKKETLDVPTFGVMGAIKQCVYCGNKEASIWDAAKTGWICLECKEEYEDNKRRSG